MSNQRLKQKLMNPNRRKAGLAGLDTAIILIAFVITASVLAYVAVNMGLFVTQKAKAVINNGEAQASTALEVGGSVLYSTNYPTNSKSYWLYFPITPSVGISSVQLAPATTSIAFTASAENVTLSNMYNYTLLASVLPDHTLIKEISGGENYYYYPSPYAALLVLETRAVVDSAVFQVVASGGHCTASSVNEFNFSVSGSNYNGCVAKDVAFTFPVSGDPAGR